MKSFWVMYKKKFFKLYSRIFSRPIFFGFNKFLFDLSIRGLGIYPPKNVEDYFYSELLPDIICKDKPVIFDIGANIGNKTHLLSRIFPLARIYSFEPNPKCFKKLEKIRTNNIKIFNSALSDKNNKIKLYDRKDKNASQHSTFYKEVITELHRSEKIEFEVNVTTLDDICIQEKIEVIDFIKIDTEGNDFYVLKGAKNLLSQNSIKCIQFEFNSMNVISRVFFRDFIQLLQNYKLYRLLPTGLVKLNSDILHTEIYGYQNLVAILDK